MSKLFNQLLTQRHLTDSFLHPRYEDLTDPFVFPDMQKAVDRLKSVLKNHEKILIYGDYDVDGVTASTLMYDALKLAGVAPENLEIMLPDRFRDGYGMSPRLVERAQKAKITLVITVDCGSRNADIIENLKKHHIDTIVTDHHECGETLPKKAIAILNPKRPDFPEKYQYLRNLAGVGVAFKFAESLVKQGMIKPGQEKWLLDLVLLGTICDQMPLTGENRILCYYGAKVLQKTRRLGLKELFRTAKVTSLTSDAIGFQLGPRLNAAGRLESAELALKLLQTTSHTEAATLAQKLEDLNKSRKTQQNTALKEIATRGLDENPIIIETGDWHEGILGIVAGHLVERYHRPAFVLTKTKDGFYKGSGRSFGEFSFAEALAATKETTLGGGGHAAAAGVKVAPDQLNSFRQKINDYYKSLRLTDQLRFLAHHPDLTVENYADFSLELLDELALLEPFGEGNETPLFRLEKTIIKNVSLLGPEKNHLRLDVTDQKGHSLKLIAFYAPKRWLEITPEDQIEPLIHLEKNEFRGITSPEGRIVDLDVL